MKRLKLVLSGDLEEKPGLFHDLQELSSYEQFLETEGQPYTVKICLIIFRSVQNKYQNIVDFLGEILMNTIVVATETWLKNKIDGKTYLSSRPICMYY